MPRAEMLAPGSSGQPTVTFFVALQLGLLAGLSTRPVRNLAHDIGRMHIPDGRPFMGEPRVVVASLPFLLHTVEHAGTS